VSSVPTPYFSVPNSIWDGTDTLKLRFQSTPIAQFYPNISVTLLKHSLFLLLPSQVQLWTEGVLVSSVPAPYFSVPN